MSGKLAALPKPANDPKADLVPPCTIEVTVNLAGERQVRLVSPVTAEMPRAEINRRMDIYRELAERQRSILEIRVLTENLQSKRDALDEVWKKRRAEADEQHQKKLGEVEKDIAAALAAQEQIKQAAYSKRLKSGRQTEGELEGDDRKQFNAKKLEIGAKKDRIKQLEQEHLQNVQVIDGNIEKLEAEIRAMERELVQHQEIVG